jgi:hypothetical protein
MTALLPLNFQIARRLFNMARRRVFYTRLTPFASGCAQKTFVLRRIFRPLNIVYERSRAKELHFFQPRFMRGKKRLRRNLTI